MANNRSMQYDRRRERCTQMEERQDKVAIPPTFWIGWILAFAMSIGGSYMTTMYATAQVVARITERVAIHDSEIRRLRDRQDELATKQDVRELRLDIVERLSTLQRSIK
jgi:cell division protein FtsB